MSVRVRFAPSPTGNPHVGNIRTALFDFLFARHNQGKLILRIEDTDKSREVKGGVEAIVDSLKWLGLDFDEGPILQSQRLPIYKEHAQILLNKTLAYQLDGAIYFKTQKEGKSSWIDLIGNKKIEFDNSVQDDFVILKSDGFPTYHLASVVDDHLMRISHVTRGEGWISSTPKHLMLYQAFGWQLPYFAHFPNILASDRSKLSKRHGAIGILDFKKEGFLPEAILNFLALLGWTPLSGKEALSLEEMIEEFDIKDVHQSPAVFDGQKLEWLNGEYIRNMPDEKLLQVLQEFLVDHPAKDKLSLLVPLVKERIKKLSDFIPLTHFIFTKPEYEKGVFEKLKIGDKNIALQKSLEKLENLPKPWDAKDFETTFRELAKDLNVSAAEMFQLLRVVISGQVVTPPLFETIKVIGEAEVVRRVKEAQKLWQSM